MSYHPVPHDSPYPPPGKSLKDSVWFCNFYVHVFGICMDVCIYIFKIWLSNFSDVTIQGSHRHHILHSQTFHPHSWQWGSHFLHHHHLAIRDTSMKCTLHHHRLHSLRRTITKMTLDAVHAWRDGMLYLSIVFSKLLVQTILFFVFGMNVQDIYLYLCVWWKLSFALYFLFWSCLFQK